MAGVLLCNCWFLRQGNQGDDSWRLRAGLRRAARYRVDGGLVVNGTTVPLSFVYGNDLSNLWKGTGEVGSATGTWRCPWCPWNKLHPAAGMPGGCSGCRCARVRETTRVNAIASGRRTREMLQRMNGRAVDAEPFGPEWLSPSERDDQWLSSRACNHHAIVTRVRFFPHAISCVVS